MPSLVKQRENFSPFWGVVFFDDIGREIDLLKRIWMCYRIVNRENENIFINERFPVVNSHSLWKNDVDFPSNLRHHYIV